MEFTSCLPPASRLRPSAVEPHAARRQRTRRASTAPPWEQPRDPAAPAYIQRGSGRAGALPLRTCTIRLPDMNLNVRRAPRDAIDGVGRAEAVDKQGTHDYARRISSRADYATLYDYARFWTLMDYPTLEGVHNRPIIGTVIGGVIA
ncbi:hypothetical protein GGX14DRAFT_566732 [Mycena pura]|uniref:Uncharacterized protein n=1 Tax=Mycena pura TaxID=153505 RepID=A0AAD6VBS2_9AGAR|nr:hypothetical protein GGX14DRAFT_566732 [Mycena pura]